MTHFPRSTGEVRRAGIAVPQTVVLRFEDGTEERFSWADDSRWKRFSVVKPAKLVSAELDPLKQNLTTRSHRPGTRTHGQG